MKIKLLAILLYPAESMANPPAADSANPTRGLLGIQDKQDLLIENQIYVKKNLVKSGMPATEHGESA